MSTSSQVSLGALRIQAQETADLENNSAVSTPAWNSFITNSYKDLYDLLVGAYGNNYYVAATYQFSTTQAQSYPLPDGSANFTDTTGSTASKFYKLLGVDLQYSASPSGWLTLKRFEWIERNRFAMPNTQTNYVGYTNLRYTLQGNNLYVAPIPQAGQVVQVWYIPTPTNLQFRLPCQTTLGESVVQVTDVTGLAPGMNVSGDGALINATIASVGTTTFTMTSSATATYSSTILSMWSDSTLIEGISGWEDYVIVDAAIKAQYKQENDDSPLVRRKLELKQRIEAMAEARDAGQAMHVSDVLGANGVWGGDDFGWGQGSNDGYWW